MGVRQQAKDRGDSRYSTGKLCINGHRSARYVSTGGCVQCVEEGRPSLPLFTILEFDEQTVRYRYLGYKPPGEELKTFGGRIVESVRHPTGRIAYVLEFPVAIHSKVFEGLAKSFKWWMV